MKINNQVQIDQIRLTDLHMHTTFCDGKDSPEDMVQAAIRKGMTCIGFSGHSFVAFDPSAGMSAERERAYRKEIRRLQDAYAGRLRIYCGIEMDYHTLPDSDSEEYEYRIGSVHYIPIPGSDCAAAVDDTPEIFQEAVEKYYHGDYYQAAEAYYRLEADVVRRTNCDIIGHFDLISKFNQRYQWFDEQHPRYVRAWQEALEALIPSGKIFEVNTGAMARGWRTVPYPAPQMQDYIRQRGGRMILSSDSHSAETIGYQFDSWIKQKMRFDNFA